jgi:hypothetical protein
LTPTNIPVSRFHTTVRDDTPLPPTLAAKE